MSKTPVKGNIPEQPAKPKRLMSLDALRGFDMFWIIGGEDLVHSLALLTNWQVFRVLSSQLEHMDWNGFTFYDLIFPLFLFISGVTVPFSILRRLQSGGSKKVEYLNLVRRVVLLVFFGTVINGITHMNWEHMRYASVLGRIGLAYGFAVLIVMNTNLRGQVIWFFALLLGYWAVMKLIPVPGYGAGDLSMEGNLASYLDRLLLPGRLYKVIHDPEGILSTVPAISTALLGIFTGQFLRYKNQRFTPLRKTLIMVVMGIIFLILGRLWDLSFPINKNLWSSSFVFYTGGWSLLLLSLFYMVIDVWNARNWAFFFVIIGMNPITIYVVQAGIIDFYSSADYIFNGAISYTVEPVRAVLIALAVFSLKWLFLYFLYKQKIFLRV